MLKELQSLGLDIVVQDKEGNAVDMRQEFDDDDSSFENNDYDLGDNVMVESELQDDYSVKDADEGFDDDLDEDAGPTLMTSPPSSLIPSTIDRIASCVILNLRGFAEWKIKNSIRLRSALLPGPDPCLELRRGHQARNHQLPHPEAGARRPVLRAHFWTYQGLGVPLRQV